MPPEKVEIIRAMIEAERSCILEYGTEFDMLSDADLAEYLFLSPVTVLNYRSRIPAPPITKRLKAYRRERKERKCK